MKSVWSQYLKKQSEQFKCTASSSVFPAVSFHANPNVKRFVYAEWSSICSRLPRMLNCCFINLFLINFQECEHLYLFEHMVDFYRYLSLCIQIRVEIELRYICV